ncbi:MAG: hypothetical protein QM831_27735 [Kofleriaceae bacterium]
MNALARTRRNTGMNVIKTRTNLPATVKGFAGEPDRAIDRVIKLVPAHVIAGYVLVLAIGDAISPGWVGYALPIAMVAGCILAATGLRAASEEQGDVPALQYYFSCATFLAWAFAIRDPLPRFGFTTPAGIPALACVAIPVFGSYFIDVVEN